MFTDQHVEEMVWTSTPGRSCRISIRLSQRSHKTGSVFMWDFMICAFFLNLLVDIGLNIYLLRETILVLTDSGQSEGAAGA